MGPREFIVRQLRRVPAWLLTRVAIFVVLAVLVYSGLLDPVERLLSDWRFNLASRPASPITSTHVAIV